MSIDIIKVHFQKSFEAVPQKRFLLQLGCSEIARDLFKTGFIFQKLISLHLTRR